MTAPGVAVDLREITEADLGRVGDIYNHAVLRTDTTLDTDPKTHAELVAWLRHHDERYPAIGAFAGGDLVGYGTLSPFAARGGYRASAELSIYLDPASVHRGIGTMLGRHLVDHAERAGMSTVLGLVTSTNAPCIRMLDKLGFEHFGVMRCIGHKMGRLVDLLVLQRLFDANIERYGGAPPYDGA